MKVTRYELVNFGAHRHTVLEPGAARLVVVTGQNGLGKTTLVSEALGYALYRDFRGSVNGPVRIGQTDCSVTVEFEFAGDAYRAIRRRTTRAAGQSSADLQRREPDGRWTKVASGDKEVPAAVRELFRMDASTFRTSVSLAQRDLDRFVVATSRERHEVLAAIVVDPRFAPAATIASRRALALERDLESERSRRDRLSDVIVELEPSRSALERARGEAQVAEAAIDAAREARDVAAGRIRIVDEELATASSVIGEQLLLTAERDEIYAAWERMEKRRAAAVTALEQANEIVADAPAIEAAAAELEAARAAVAVLVDDEARDRKLAAEISEAQAAFDEIDRPLAEKITTWRTKRGIEEARIRELEEHARAGTTTCATCGKTVDPADGPRAAPCGPSPVHRTRRPAEGATVARADVRRPAARHQPPA
jgi:DNA repair exonuclease SbcCD ATPase subunit